LGSADLEQLLAIIGAPAPCRAWGGEFAQFEREVVGQRVRDKTVASKRKGMGGVPPLGYSVEDR
jgi:hypothetical protein